MKVHVISKIVDSSHARKTRKEVVKGIILKGETENKRRRELLKVCKEIAEREANEIYSDLSNPKDKSSLTNLTKTVVIGYDNYIIQIKYPSPKGVVTRTIIVMNKEFELKEVDLKKIYAFYGYWDIHQRDYFFDEEINLTNLNFDISKITTNKTEALQWFEETKSKFKKQADGREFCFFNDDNSGNLMKEVEITYCCEETLLAITGRCSIYEAPLN